MAPFMTPWSVRPMAGWSNFAAWAARASTLHAPSSSEYSEWTWRWTQAGSLTGRLRICAAPVGNPGAAGAFPLLAVPGALEPAGQGLDGADVAADRPPLGPVGLAAQEALEGRLGGLDGDRGGRPGRRGEDRERAVAGGLDPEVAAPRTGDLVRDDEVLAGGPGGVDQVG